MDHDEQDEQESIATVFQRIDRAFVNSLSKGQHQMLCKWLYSAWINEGEKSPFGLFIVSMLVRRPDQLLLFRLWLGVLDEYAQAATEIFGEVG